MEHEALPDHVMVPTNQTFWYMIVGEYYLKERHEMSNQLAVND